MVKTAPRLIQVLPDLLSFIEGEILVGHNIQSFDLLFIYKAAEELLQKDVTFMVLCGVILLILVLLFWKEFKLFIFDMEYARSLGFPANKINLLLSFMIVMTIIIGLQTVGVILMSAMLIAPAVAARQWTDRLWIMVTLSSVFGAVSGILGTIASSLTAKLPTGPAIVVFISSIVIFSILFAPGRGIIQKILHRKNLKQLIKNKGGNEDVTTI